MEDSGEKEQYSKMSILGRICQHFTTHEQTTFTPNHHHTPTPDKRQTTIEYAKTTHPSSFSKNSDKCSQAATGEDFSSSNKSDSRPSNSLFQTACSKQQEAQGLHSLSALFSSKKRTSPRRLLQDKTTSRTHDKKKPNRAISEFFFIKNPSTCSGTFQRRIRAISRQDPPARCTKQ